MHFMLPKVFVDVDEKTPCVFVLSRGADPMALLLKFAASMGMENNLEVVSLGKGQGCRAEDVIKVQQPTIPIAAAFTFVKYIAKIGIGNDSIQKLMCETIRCGVVVFFDMGVCYSCILFRMLLKSIEGPKLQHVSRMRRYFFCRMRLLSICLWCPSCCTPGCDIEW